MGSPAPLLDRSSCATWGTESPGSAWGISTPKAEREFELDHNLPSGSWAGRGGSDHSPDPAGCAYDPPSKRAAYEGNGDTFELACAPCTGCGLDEPFARDLDSGDPYCKDCWCAKGHIVETIGISSRGKARIKLCFTTANVHNPCLLGTHTSRAWKTRASSRARTTRTDAFGRRPRAPSASMRSSRKS